MERVWDVIIFATKGKFQFPNNRPQNIITCSRIAGNKLIHPNQKPIVLMKHLIRAITKPGDIVLDPFTGSGSTLIAAAKTGRKYIGIEIDEEYSKIARARLAKVSVKEGK